MAEKNSLWKNIRNKAAKNRRTGDKPKEPTKEMLRQKRKIKAKKYAEGGETDPPYRPLGIPMEGYKPDSVFYETPTRYSKPEPKLEVKPKPTSKRSEVQNYYLNQTLNQNSSTPKPDKYVAERESTSSPNIISLEDKIKSSNNNLEIQKEKQNQLEKLNQERISLRKKLDSGTGSWIERSDAMKRLSQIDNELGTKSLDKEYDILNKAGQIGIKAGKYILPGAAPVLNAIDTGLDVYQYSTNPNIQNATSLQFDMMSPYKITSRSGRSIKPFGVIGDIYDTHNILNEKAQGGYMYAEGGDSKDEPVTLYNKAYYNPDQDRIISYAGSQDNKYYQLPGDEMIQSRLPEFEIIEDTGLYNPNVVGPAASRYMPSEAGLVQNPNFRNGDALEYVPIEAALLPANLPIKAATKLGKLGVGALEVAIDNPGLGVGSIVKNVGKGVEKYSKRALRSNYNPLSIPIKNIGTKIARISDNQYRDYNQILDALKGKSQNRYFGQHLNQDDFSNIKYGINDRDLNKTYFKGDKTNLKELKYDTSKDLGLKSSEDWYGNLNAYELNSEIPNNEKLDIIDFLKSMNTYQWNEADNFKTGQYVLSEGIENLMKDYPGENLLNLGKLTGNKRIGLETFNDEQLKVVKDNLRHLFEKHGSDKIPFEVGKAKPSTEGIQLFGSPVKPIDDIAGHMGFLERNPVTGDINYTTRDVWGFNPKAYSEKYGITRKGEKIKPFEKLQVHLMDSFGKPFILHQTNPLKFKDGGYTNPYMYYSGGPMYYGDGGKIWKHIGAGAYGILEGGLDTLTFGATDKLTDKGFDWLTKVGNKNLDLNDPKNAKFLRTQQQIRGYSNVAGAIGTAAFTGQWGSAIGQSAKGVNTAFQATEGLSDDFKKWSNIGSQAIGIGAGLAGGNLNSAQSASKIGQAATKFGSQASKVAPYANQAMGMLGNSGQPLWQQAEARQEYLNSPEYLAMKEQQNQAYVNQGLSFAANGGPVNNNLLTLQTDSMRNRYKTYKTKYSRGGKVQDNAEEKLEYFGMTKVPNHSGFHYENPNGGSYGGKNASFEKNEIVLHAKGGPTPGPGKFVFPSEVNGQQNRQAFLEIDENGIPKPLNMTIAQFVEREAVKKGSPFRTENSLGKERVDIANQQAMEMVAYYDQLDQQQAQQKQMMVGGALQYVAAGGKINGDIEKILNDDIQSYVEADNYYAYGGYLPKNKNFNMPNSYAKGGSIHIKESKKGTFTAAAKKRGKSVQEFARDVLRNKGNYSAAMVKKANFAKNAAGWKHAEGGNITPDNPGFNALPEYVQAKIMSNMAVGGPLYGNTDSEYTYAHGGPVVSNVNQDFDLYAQNRGGMMMSQGGNMYFEGGDFGPVDHSFHMSTAPDVIEDLPEYISSSPSSNVNLEALGITTPNFTYINPAVYNTSPNEIQDLPGFNNTINVSDDAIGLNQNQSRAFFPDPPKLNFTESDVKKYGLDSNINNINVIPDPVKSPNQPNQGLTGLDYVSMGMQALPYFYQTAVGLKGADPVNYQRVTGEKIDPTVAIALSAEEARRAQDSSAYLMRQNAPTSGSYMNNLRNLSLQSGKQRGALAGGLRYQADIANTQMQNELNKVNAGISMQEQIDRLQEKDAARTNITEGLSGLGSTTANVIRDYRTNQINQTIAKNIGTNNYKYDPVNQTITYADQSGKMVTIPAQTVISPNVAANVGTGQIQQPGTSQFETGFDNRLNESFANRFRGSNAGK